MSIPIFEACKKRKRIPKLYGLHSFADPRCCSLWSLSRQHNIRVFLQECAELEDYNVEGMPIWCTLLVHENRGFFVSFYTIEESAKHSLRPFCDQCRCTGKARILFSLIVWFFNWVSVPSLLDKFMSAGVPESQWTRVYWIICKTKDQIPLNWDWATSDVQLIAPRPQSNF